MSTSISPFNNCNITSYWNSINNDNSDKNSGKNSNNNSDKNSEDESYANMIPI